MRRILHRLADGRLPFSSLTPCPAHVLPPLPPSPPSFAGREDRSFFFLRTSPATSLFCTMRTRCFVFSPNGLGFPFLPECPWSASIKFLSHRDPTTPKGVSRLSFLSSFFFRREWRPGSFSFFFVRCPCHLASLREYMTSFISFTTRQPLPLPGEKNVSPFSPVPHDRLFPCLRKARPLV